MSAIEFNQGTSGIVSILHEVDNVAITGIVAAKYSMYGSAGNVLLTKTLGSGIEFVDGKIKISFSEDDTKELSGKFTHECLVIDSLNRPLFVLTGTIRFTPTRARLA